MAFWTWPARAGSLGMSIGAKSKTAFRGEPTKRWKPRPHGCAKANYAAQESGGHDGWCRQRPRNGGPIHPRSFGLWPPPVEATPGDGGRASHSDLCSWMWIRKHGPERILNFTRWIGSVDEENIKGAG